MTAALLSYWIVPRFGWRWLLIIGGLPALVAIYLRWGLPESPRWLAGRGRDEEAEKAMATIEQQVKKAYRAELPEPAPIRLATEAKRTRVMELLSGIYLKRTIVVWIIWFSAYLTTYGMMTWLPSLYRTVYKLPLDKSLLYTILTQSAGFVGSIPRGCRTDRQDRPPRSHHHRFFSRWRIPFRALVRRGFNRNSGLHIGHVRVFLYWSDLSFSLCVYSGTAIRHECVRSAAALPAPGCGWRQ